MKQKDKLRVSLIGGHLAPAEAVAVQLRESNPDVALEFIGRQNVFTSASAVVSSVERMVMKDKVDIIIDLPIERLTYLPRSWMHFMVSLFICIRHFLVQRPNCVVSFGGYVAFPVCLAAMICNIPLLLHEQTHVFGASNSFFKRFAKKVCVSFRDLVQGSYVYTGFPIRSDILKSPEKLSFALVETEPVLYITGGTTGATAINELLFQLIPTLVNDWVIVHQTGNLSFDQANYVKHELNVDVQNRYIPLEFLQSQDVSWLLHHARCVVSRAGANTVYELAYTKTPSVLFPILGSSGREQEINAEWLVNFAPSVWLNQKTVSSDDVRKAIDKSMAIQKENRPYESVPTNGAENIVFEIQSLLP
jgi:UDP-N-acetylglucosamine:LPS N-acetylglucosamine transferase